MKYPKDIRSFLLFLENNGEFDNLMGNLIAQWGPNDKPLLSAQFLPPRLVEKNQDTISDVRFKTVAAIDGTRYSPAQLVESGELFASLNYRLGHSDLARQITGPDYDGLNSWLNGNQGMLASGTLLGIVDLYILRGLVEHDEIANWEAIVYNKISRRGDNAYYDYENGPDISAARVAASDDWTDPTYDPWTGDIIPRINYLVSLGYNRKGIRVVTSDLAIQTLAANPFTTRRVYGPLLLGTDQTLADIAGPVGNPEVLNAFSRLGVGEVIINDVIISTITGDKRPYPQDHMTFIASTGRTEQVRYDPADPSKVKIVTNTLGFNAIGKANAQTSPGRRTFSEAFTRTKDARVELQGFQATGPIILDPEAIADISGIELI